MSERRDIGDVPQSVADQTHPADRPMTLVKSEGLDDWYTIEWAEHEHTHGFVRLSETGSAYWHSGRVCNACVEGPAEHMAGIAHAIETYGNFEERRCAVVQTINGRVALFSPRNSLREHIASDEAAQHLAREIRRVLAEATRDA